MIGNRAWRCRMRCLECRADIAERAQVCARCGAHVARQVSVSAERAEDGSGDPVAPPPGASVQHAAGRGSGPGSRQNAWLMAVMGLVVLVAVTEKLAEVPCAGTWPVGIR